MEARKSMEFLAQVHFMECLSALTLDIDFPALHTKLLPKLQIYRMFCYSHGTLYNIAFAQGTHFL